MYDSGYDAYRQSEIQVKAATASPAQLVLMLLDGLMDELARAVPRARLLKLPGCGHSPHRDQPALVLERGDFFGEEALVSGAVRSASVIMLEDGGIVEQSDDAEAFFTNPKTERAKRFLHTFEFDRHRKPAEPTGTSAE